MLWITTKTLGAAWLLATGTAMVDTGDAAGAHTPDAAVLRNLDCSRVHRATAPAESGGHEGGLEVPIGLNEGNPSLWGILLFFRS